MRPGQNKRMRGRNNNNNNRKGPNPLTRSYESNGPDVKIRGTAHHIGEKYLQLARDAQSSGDPVMAESYLQHAEHYFRLIAAAQQAQQQAQFGYQRQPGDPVEQDDGDDDDDFGGLPDRFASPVERVVQPPPPPIQDRQPWNGQPQAASERYERPNGQNQYADRQSGDRPNYDRQDRNFDNRNRNGSQERSGYPERSAPERSAPERNGLDRNGPYRNDAGQPREDRPPRDFDNRGYRNRNRDDRQSYREGGQPRDSREHMQPREPREGNPPRDPRQPSAEEQPGTGLPAFITAPVRTLQDPPAIEPTNAAAADEGASDAPEEAGFHMRPRRRRRPKPDFSGGDDGESVQDASASDPVGD